MIKEKQNNFLSDEINLPQINICNYEIMEVIKYLCPTLLKYVYKDTKKYTEESDNFKEIPICFILNRD